VNDPEVVNLRRLSAARERDAYFEGIREAVVRGTGRDFAQGTGIGGPAFEACLRGLLREALDRATITGLLQLYRMPDGQPFAAQALNRLAAPLAARCGHRAYVPELVEASRGLRGGG
jgi:hypothetical protein